MSKTATFVKDVCLTSRATQAMYRLSEPFVDEIWNSGAHEFVIVSSNYSEDDCAFVPCDKDGKTVYPYTWGINTPLKAMPHADALKAFGYEVAA